MLSQIAPSLDVFSASIFPILLPAILIGGALYFAVSLTRGRTSFQTEVARTEPAGENPVLETLYALALAVLIAALVGFGVEAIYPTPDSPQDTALTRGASVPPPDLGSANALPGADTPSGGPPDLGSGAPDNAATAAYDQEINNHDQVGSVIAIVAAVLILVASLTPRVGRLPVIGDGVTLGGVLTLFYAIVLAAQTPSGWLVFLVVAVSLVALLAILYRKFRPRGSAAGS